MIVQPYDLEIISNAFKAIESAADYDCVHDMRMVVVNLGYVIGEIRFNDGLLVIDMSNYGGVPYSLGGNDAIPD